MNTLNDSNLKAAKLPRLLGSILYDLIIIIAILLFATTLLFFICLLLSINQPEPQNIYFRAYLAVIIFSYYHWSWAYHRQTIGMKAWNLVLINHTHLDKITQITPITLGQSLLRIIGGVIGAICFGFGYIYLYLNKQRKTLADSLSNTKIYHVSN